MLDTSFSLPESLKGRITSNQENLEMGKQERMLFQAYVPGMEFQEQKVKKPDIIIQHRESDEGKINKRGKVITVCDNWRDKISFDIYHLLYGATRKELLKRDAYPVHASCVEKNGRHILLIGHSGTGKSTTALKLVQEHGMKMVSGNKTVVKFDDKKDLRVIAGTPTMTIRQSDQAKFASVIGESVSYYDRLAFKLHEDEYTAPFGGKIEAIVLVLLNDGVQDFGQLNPRSAVHKSYPYFLDVVNADVMVCGENDIFDGTPPPGTKKKLRQSMKVGLQNTPVYSVAGPISYVTDRISKL